MSSKPHQIIGNSTALKATLAKAKKVAKTVLPVLITGESGTGKELFAQFIHDQSRRAQKPFVAVNCAAIPAELLEAELFGYKKGAFSGATSDKDGLFVQASTGTLFLDEIGDMPLPLQAKILRVLQEGEVRPVGAKAVQKVDVRILSATHRDLAEMAEERKFREDLIFRLKGYAIQLPALRERGHDIVKLARAFLKSREDFTGTGLSRDAQTLLMAYHWPGNVRELQNIILAAAVDARRNIFAEHLVGHLPDTVGVEDPNKSVKERITSALQQAGSLALVDLQSRLKIPKPTIHRHLSRMVAEGDVSRSVVSGQTIFALAAPDSEDEMPQLTQRQEQAVALTRALGRITRQELATELGISIRTASRELSALVTMGALGPDGQSGRMAGYRCLF
ncbi:sigma-54 factor, interaction domain-containing protein [Magnetococcus marinus MC-1]|uniref:Sigma-54 factor, interaction domain-containing protein n=1 Tax=Magnetococcus marinus (strain ATCC BAA-1437 / JCM 17883 / MC-1) TaxID=156889 RepID=A0L7D1_MAGMM|nr:sigma 54-interacting transcriptional regulator [Magnetococcus marinus]ABK43874.1 sigma-54 factor, interaction domain-containing protein [Magnetococcus marinus MC-1]